MSGPVFKVSANVPEFQDAMARYIRHFGKGRKAGIREQAAWLADRLVRFTPPQRGAAQGRRAVARDIRRAFFGLKKAQQAAWQTFEGRQVSRLFSTKDGRVYGADALHFMPSPTMEQMRAHHESLRDKRGRVTKAGSYSQDVGRWRFITRMVVPEDKLRSYIKARQEGVGQARGGWARALVDLAPYAPKTMKPGAYITKHLRAGQFEDTLDKGSDGFIRIENRSRWASGGDESRIMRNALASRTRWMVGAVAKAEQEAQAAAFRGGSRLAAALTT